MGVQFKAYDSTTDTFVSDSVDMSYPTAAKVGELLGLTFVTARTADGECTLAQLRAGLERIPDGHADRLINQRLGELLRLLLAAEKTNRNLLITWG